MTKFRIIRDFPTYQVSSEGEFINSLTGGTVQVRFGEDASTAHINLQTTKGFVKRSPAVLVAETFPELVEVRCERKEMIGYKDQDRSNLFASNLYWTSTSQQQNEKWERIRKERKEQFGIPTFDDKTTGFFPDGIECKSKPGYYFVPGIEGVVVINKEGKLFNLAEGMEQEPLESKKGYLIGYSYDHLGARRINVHRAVASIFNPIREELKQNYAIRDLQVNHVDGNKKNNRSDNLEWVTGTENMNHGRDNNLFSNQISVLAKNPETGETLTFRSISKAAEFLKISVGTVSNYLSNHLAGTYTVAGWLLKHNDGFEWPERLPLESLCDGSKLNGHYVSTDTKTNKSYIHNSFIDAMVYHDLVTYTVKNHRQRKGCDVPFKGLLFEHIDDFMKRIKHGALRI